MTAEQPTEADRYWHSSVSRVTPHKVFIRGYDLEDLVGGLPFTAASYLLIKGELPTPQQARVLDAVLTAILDYSLHKPGTAAARYVVSANPSMVAGLAAATMAVGENTLATEDTARFITASCAQYRESGRPMNAFAADLVERMAASKRRIPGLGHPVFKKTDPRAVILRRIAVEEGLWNQPAQLYEAIHAAFTARPGKADIPINDVGLMAAVLVALGFSPEEGTGLAVISTLPGVVAHISEELTSGKPIRIIPDATVSYDVADDKDFSTDWKEAGWTPGA
ncbi:citryl-CoA lyase [Streptomyces sp. GMR22]|uniref:citryl-CoA lyase n=1 Tax=Streptomyces sp. GMR22 TaxID=2759524 RepID=UPI0015F7A98C|nr:citryl-CoA lyase [Streptomyces sp. GMR22]MBA6440768.1 citryl-CoA lyase [Streptomyces sp. GMR22]